MNHTKTSAKKHWSILEHDKEGICKRCRYKQFSDLETTALRSNKNNDFMDICVDFQLILHYKIVTNFR